MEKENNKQIKKEELEDPSDNEVLNKTGTGLQAVRQVLMELIGLQNKLCEFIMLLTNKITILLSKR